jgi:hypothetical protein
MRRRQARGAGWLIVLTGALITALAVARLLPTPSDQPSAELAPTSDAQRSPELVPPAPGHVLGWIARLTLAAAVIVSAFGVSVLAFPKTFGGFTASRHNPGDSVSAGTLQMTNTPSTGAIVTFAGAKPGTSQAGTVTIKNSGTLPATSMSLSIGTATDKTCVANGGGCPSGTGTGNLSAEATITVVDTSRTGSPTVFGPVTIGSAAGSHSLLGTGGASTWAAAESHQLTVTLNMPSDTSDSDAYQGTSTTFDISFAGAS